MINHLSDWLRIRRYSITSIMLVSTVVVGMSVWFISDKIQTAEISAMFHSKLAERLARQAQEERTLFDNYIKSHHQAVKILADSNRLHEYISNNMSGEFPADNGGIKYYKEVPEWLPGMSSLRRLVQPRYVLLLDRSKRVREVYTGYEDMPPKGLVKPDEMLIHLSYHQSYLTTIEDKPYLITSEFVSDRSNQPIAILMMASPMDSRFLTASQGVRSDVSKIAMLEQGGSKILVSSNNDLLPIGESLDNLSDRYLIKGQALIDYGSSFPVELVSFISTEEITQTTGGILSKERFSRAMTAAAYIISFALLVFWITGRIKRLTQKVMEFSESMDIKQPKERHGNQIDILEDRFYYFADAIRKETKELEYQALHDTLTELPNRKFLNNKIQHEIINGNLQGGKFTFILGDLNRFKEVNDTLGHHIGDQVLQQVSERLFYTFRKSDVVARLGGDEFGILLPDTSVETTISILDKVVEAFEIPFVVEQHYFTIGISLGLVEYPEHGDDVNILLKRADIAMYNAKKINSLYTVYDYSEDHHSIGRLALTQDLRKAIELESLEIYYQSKIDIQSEQVTSAEALLRWRHPERGFISPDEFIPLAEQTGLIKPLTEWVLENALAQLAAWQQDGINISMAINISPCCLHDVKLPDVVRKLIRKYNIVPRDCILELTETAIMTNPMKAREILAELDMMGVIISIDDFGTGYSSLAYLKQLPVEELKIDRSFIMEMSKDESDAAIVQATVTMAHNLGLRVVAEGVEDEETWNLLKSLNCDIAQGFFKHRPMPAKDFYKMMKNRMAESNGKAVKNRKAV